MRLHRSKILRFLPGEIHHDVGTNQAPDHGRVSSRRAMRRVVVGASRFASGEKRSAQSRSRVTRQRRPYPRALS